MHVLGQGRSTAGAWSRSRHCLIRYAHFSARPAHWKCPPQVRQLLRKSSACPCGPASTGSGFPAASATTGLSRSRRNGTWGAGSSLNGPRGGRPAPCAVTGRATDRIAVMQAGRIVQIGAQVHGRSCAAPASSRRAGGADGRCPPRQSGAAGRPGRHPGRSPTRWS